MSTPLAHRFHATRSISFPANSHPVNTTAANTLADLLGTTASATDEPGDGLNVSLAGAPWSLADTPSDTDRPWLWARITSEGKGEITASEPALLYALVHLLADGLTEAQYEQLEDGWLLEASFSWNRILFDSVLTQVARTTRNFDPEAYIEHLARSGFTHLEVNGLASHTPHEPGVPSEYYNQFYTYCPGLMQFVDSKLTQGLYDIEYQEANLQRLKKMAALGHKYGLKPGLLCFEPRSLPERFYQRYPTLRGARIDHPFRSHMPRYTLAQDHPVAREHYRELMDNLMQEVPDLAYLSVWTNDSGAGFEHTGSLYVGRNGGPYMIREWRSHEQIAQAAGTSAIRWLRLMRDTAAETNPDFEVSLRVEPFKDEHDIILAGMGDGLTVEAPSLMVRGYEVPYSHPRYEEQTSVGGTIMHTSMDEAEKDILKDWRAKGFEPKITYSASSSFNMEPLLGIPFPRMLHKKLMALREMDARQVSAFGGLLNTEKTPYWPHPEVIRAAQLTPEISIDDVVHQLATKWAGADHAKELVDLWDATEEAVSYFPIVPLYSFFGFVWLRTWVRPLIPNLEAIPLEDRTYYERYLVSTANNPNINDLGKDVLFDLIPQEDGRRMAGHFDNNALPRLDAALERATTLAEETEGDAQAVFADLRDRIRVLRCWTTTQRNTCAWVGGVHGYLNTDDEAEKADQLAYIQDMIDRDLANTHDLLDLWETTDHELILVSDVGETSFVYGDNLGDLLRRKIDLTEQYRNAEPYIDTDIMWRIT
ncbi:MAG TPA: hypothetical protein VKP65_26015 [Rhodothermales bacterium]|nr:hypothetical protein [Rhodothermales bacterium]